MLTVCKKAKSDYMATVAMMTKDSSPRQENARKYLRKSVSKNRRSDMKETKVVGYV